MKRLSILMIVLVILTLASVSLANSSADYSFMPSDVRQAIQEVVKSNQSDPPVDLIFLLNVKFSRETQMYLNKFRSPITIDLGDVVIEYDYGYDGGSVWVRLWVDKSCGFCIGNDACFVGSPGWHYKDEDDRLADCERHILAYLHGHGQAAFWKAFKTAVQSGPKKK